MRRLFFRCSGGHYFRGQGCPFDGWWDPAADDILAIERDCIATGRELTLEALCEVATTARLLHRVLIIENGDAVAEFEALAPSHLMAGGRMLAEDEFPIQLM